MRIQIIEGHFSTFDPDVAKMGAKIVDATVELHSLVMNNFLPSAVKFHYQFNMRELTNIAQGMTRSVKEFFRVSRHQLKANTSSRSNQLCSSPLSIKDVYSLS